MRVEYINKEELLDKIQNLCDMCGEQNRNCGVMCGTCYLYSAIDIIEDMDMLILDEDEYGNIKGEE